MVARYNYSNGQFTLREMHNYRLLENSHLGQIYVQRNVIMRTLMKKNWFGRCSTICNELIDRNNWTTFYTNQILFFLVSEQELINVRFTVPVRDHSLNFIDHVFPVVFGSYIIWEIINVNFRWIKEYVVILIFFLFIIIFTVLGFLWQWYPYANNWMSWWYWPTV